MGENSLTSGDRDVLRAAGSYVRDLPPLESRASTLADNIFASMLATALPRTDALPMLVGEQDIDVRIANRTLLAIEADGEVVFPEVQFANGREIPYWARVCAAFPDSTSVLVRTVFITTASCDLVIAGCQVSPRQWLVSGRAPDAVISLLLHTFDSRA